MPIHGIRYGSAPPVGAALVTQLGDVWLVAVIYAHREGGYAWEAVRTFGKGIEAERAATEYATERNSRLKGWIARRKAAEAAAGP